MKINKIMDNTDKLPTYGTQDEDKQNNGCFVYLHLVYRMLSVYLYCPLFCLSSSCVPYVVSFSNIDKLATYGTQDEDKQNNGQYR
jgi:hypothetical protein